MHTVQPWLLRRGFNPQARKSIGCVGGHAIGLNSWTGTEGSPVSSLKCDRWQWLNLEPFNCCLHCQLILMFQATWAVSRPSRVEGRVHELGGWPVTGLPNGHAGCGPAYRPATWLGTEKRSWYKAGRIIEIQYKTTQQHNTHALRVAQWA